MSDLIFKCTLQFPAERNGTGYLLKAPPLVFASCQSTLSPDLNRSNDFHESGVDVDPNVRSGIKVTLQHGDHFDFCTMQFAE